MRSSIRIEVWLWIATLAVGLLIVPCGTRAADNLLNNGDFGRGSGNSVDEWRTDAWILTPGTTDYQWIRPQGGHSGEIQLWTHRDNDARWVQQVSLGPGWYYISADVKTVGVLSTFTGANVSVLEDGIASADLKGDNDWHRLGLYLKVGPRGADVDVALRLGGYMNLTRGQAFFRDARVVRVSGPPPGATQVFDLDQVRKEEVSGPVGRPWTLVATLIALAGLAGVGWRMMGTPAPAAAEAAKAEPSPRPRRKRSLRQRG
ncbi:MAG TPA: hypothetical protein VEF07_07985 [Candidatus Binataceae bacterium]|nr:hypothetical protein [Candidatus Binataceae bacterium]